METDYINRMDDTSADYNNCLYEAVLFCIMSGTLLSFWNKDGKSAMVQKTSDSTSSGVKRKADKQPISDKSAKIPKTSEKRNREAWNNDWDSVFPWLDKTESDGNLRAVCKWCKSCKKSNSMATAGSPNLQSSTFSRHESTKDHIMASEAHRVKERKRTIQQVVEDLTSKEVDVEADEAKEAQMRTMYYIAKEGQPIFQYSQLIKLQIQNKCPDLQDKSKIYTSEEARTEMLDAISETIEEQVDFDINNSEFIGIIVDESTDLTVHKKLNVYVKCLSENKESVVHFVDCINVHNGKAETIVSEIVKLMLAKDIPFKKLITLASDCASVMTGRLNGVDARLKNEVNDKMMQVHYVAHRLALAAGQACRDIQLFNDYQHTLKLVYRYFANSAVRYNELRAIMELLKEEDVVYLTLKELASFRWLSLEGAVRAIDTCYPALYTALENDAAKGVSEAKGIFNRVKSVTFVLCTGFMLDTLGVVGKLSRVFQRDLIDIETMNIMVDATKLKLEQMKTVSGIELSKTYDNLSESVYRGVKLMDKESLRIQFQNNADSYLQKLVEYLDDRFEKDSMRNLQLLNAVLNPSLVPKTANRLNTYGESELKELIEMYGGDEGYINGERALMDYFQVKVVLKTLNCNLSEACTVMVSKYSDVFPDFASLATIVLVSLITSVACERGFSTHNKLKTKARACLKHDTLTKLIRIKEEGQSLEKFDPKPCVRKFCAMKNRRK